MSQSKLHSALESGAQILIGYLINVVVGIIAFPWFGADFTVRQNFEIGLVFMAVAFVRSYFLRRAFNHLHRKAAA